jgi:metal transporter CNNM
MALLGSSPKATFLRRSSSGGEGNTVSVRGNVHDMREHLKHLGPSNLASRPKTTRYNTVKIKGSTGKPLRSDSIVTESIVEEPYLDNPTPLGGGEGAGLLKSAGQDAKDGVQAVQQGYGSFAQDGGSNLSYVLSVDGASKTPANGNSSPKSPKPWGFERQPSQGSSKSDDTVGSLVSIGRTPSTRKKGVARSGSITETHVDSGGVRKVVLEANGNSADEREGSSGSSAKSSPTYAGPDSDHDEQHEAGGESAGAKKKRRRVRRKKNNGSNTGDEGL